MDASVDLIRGQRLFDLVLDDYLYSRPVKLGANCQRFICWCRLLLILFSCDLDLLLSQLVHHILQLLDLLLHTSPIQFSHAQSVLLVFHCLIQLLQRLRRLLQTHCLCICSLRSVMLLVLGSQLLLVC